MTGDTPQPIRLDAPHARIVDDDDLLGREAAIVARVQADPLLQVEPAPAVRRPALPPSRRPVLGEVLAAARWEREVIACADDVRDALDRVQAEAVRARLDDADRATLIARVLADLREWQIRDCRPLVRAVLGESAENAAKVQAVSLVRDDEPHPDPVETAVILTLTADLVRRYVVLPVEAADAIALWVAAAWSLASAQISPVLLIVAASMRCGKSTLAEIVAACSPRALMVASLTPAVLFRLIDQYNPTLVADEADAWLNDEKSELRGIWNAGHSRSTAMVARCVGDDHEVRLYSTFAPRVLAMIGRPPATILDRSIVVELKRKKADERVDRLRRDRLEAEGDALRRRWRRWSEDHTEILAGAEPVVPADLNDRAADNWRHMLAIAELAGGDWPARASRAALGSVEATSDDAEGIGVELLADLRAIFDERNTDAVSSTDITAALVAMDGRPWADWSQGRPLTSAKLARLMKPFRIHPVDVRLPAGVRKCYTRRSLTDAWSRYLPEKAQHRDNANVYGPDTVKTKAQQISSCCAFESATKPIDTGAKRDCCGVALSSGENHPSECVRGDDDGGI